MQDAFRNNIHDTNLLALAALDVILNTLQQIIGQDLKKSAVHFCDYVQQDAREPLVFFLFVDNITEDTSGHSNICTCKFIVMIGF